MKGLKKKGVQNYPFMHGGTGTNKCGIGTRLLLPFFP